ncbi:MAG TPA: phosphotransferase [Gemmataceae bacterium]|nr:phosphotransferase [Gemmataceae bacterium]
MLDDLHSSHLLASAPTTTDQDRERAPRLSAPEQVIDPASASKVADALLVYLRQQLGSRELGYAQAPVAFSEGWETYTYHFQLQGPALPSAFARPLTLRIYASPNGTRRAEHEFAVQRHLAALGYPVPEPLLLEKSSDLFGGPFFLMETVLGRMSLDMLLWQPWQIVTFPAQLAAIHARLHELSAAAFPAPRGGFLGRQLDQIGTVIREHGLQGLAPGLDWLRARRPELSAPPSILHLDFHPLNLIRRADGSLAVIDWTYADVGDPHADVATTLMLMQCVPVQGKDPWERLAIRWGRPMLWWQYLHAYRRRAPLDWGRLAYYRPYAALRRLARYGRWLHAGPEVTGSKPSLLEHLSPAHLAALGRYFHKWTGVAVRI